MGTELDIDVGLNAPYGARCFLTGTSPSPLNERKDGLNAPYGARCFLTAINEDEPTRSREDVLMHLMALGAF